MTRASEYVDLLVRVYGFAYVLSRFAYSASWPPFINQTWPAHHSTLICLCGFVGLLMFEWLLTLLCGRLLLIKHDLRIIVSWFACAGLWVCLCLNDCLLCFVAALFNQTWPAHHSTLICLRGLVGLLMFEWLLTLLRGRLLLIKHDPRIRVRWFACAGLWVCLCFEPFCLLCFVAAFY